MSYWYQPKKEDMGVDGDELNIYLGSDDSGNIYAAPKIKDLLEVLQTNKEMQLAARDN